MKPNQYSDFTSEELFKKLKKAKSTVTVFSVLFILMTICCLIVTVRKGFTIISAFPLIFFPILVRNINDFRAVQTELNKRSE